MYIVGFNGPPGSGKDSIAEATSNLLQETYEIDTYAVSLAGPMREIGMNLLGLDSEDAESYAMAKETEWDLFTRETCKAGNYPKPPTISKDNLRQFIIALAEEFIRPRYGRNFWARKLKLDHMFIWNSPAIILVRDIGFQEEVDYFQEQVGEKNFILARLERDGCDFSIDSRGYCEAEQFVHIYNNASLGWAAQAIVAQMIHRGWTLD